MWQKNNGQSEAEVLQNRFTAYLSSAIIRRRKEYILQAVRRQQIESLTEKTVVCTGRYYGEADTGGGIAAIDATGK